jgi:hypothetical protein
MFKRSPLKSEHAIIQLAYNEESMQLPDDIQVCKEEYEQQNDCFNADFAIWFVDTFPLEAKLKSHVLPVMPNTLGAELFVVFDENQVPILVRLIGGDNFPVIDFANTIKDVHKILSEARALPSFNESFVRIVDLGSVVSFLVATGPLVEFMYISPSRMSSSLYDLDVRRLGTNSYMLDGYVLRE